MAGKTLKKTTNNGNFDEMVKQVEAERNVAPVMKPIEDDGYELVAGYTDDNGTLHNTFTIRPMNGEDEEYFARFNNATAAKMMSMIAERCTESIGSIKKSDVSKKVWHDIIENLYVADVDCIVMHIRETSLGEELEIVHTCGECNSKITTRMTVDELEVKEWDGEEGIPFELKHGVRDKDGNLHTAGILRYPRCIDREATVPIARKNGARGTTLMLSRLVSFDDETFKVTEKTIQQMSTVDRRYLTNLLEENQFGLDMSVQIECPECGNTFTGGLSATNFI